MTLVAADGGHIVGGGVVGEDGAAAVLEVRLKEDGMDKGTMNLVSVNLMGGV